LPKKRRQKIILSMSAKFDRLAAQPGRAFFNHPAGLAQTRQSGVTHFAGDALSAGGKASQPVPPLERRWERRAKARQLVLFLARDLQWPDSGKPD
jgi:hypothetical protein